MKRLLSILLLSTALLAPAPIVMARDDHRHRHHDAPYCLAERRCKRCGQTIYHGHNTSRRSSHYGDHFHSRHNCYVRDDRHDHHRHDDHHRRSGFFLFF